MCITNAVTLHVADAVNALHPATTTFVHADVTQPEDLVRLVQATLQLHGRLDCLVNNACVASS
jgi:NAD(P)-dependent dehydrogenase (short-subunit alcohol dehydrogenase family)